MRPTSLLSFAVGAALGVTALVGPVSPGGAAPRVGDPADPAVPPAVAWLTDQQQADGGFELAGFPGFETADAILALASAGQADATWSTSEALAAVQAVETDGGKNALDAIDDLVDGATNAGQVAKLITLVVAPLGLDATDFDPSDDSAEAVDLEALMLGAAGTEQDYAAVAFNGRLYVMLALAATGHPVPAPLVTAVETAQQPNGSWSYTGLPTGTDTDADTTGLAIPALLAAGVDVTGPTITGGLRSLARTQQRSGAWLAFGALDPNSTARAVFAVETASGDADQPCWREAVLPAFDGVPYVAARDWLRTQQDPSGRITSPNDGFGINTFPTSQVVQALVHTWVVGGTDTLACGTSTAPERFVHAAYSDVLGRLADPAGTAFHTDRIQGGAPRASVPAALQASVEYRNGVVNAWFAQYLSRPADAGARTSFGAMLQANRRFDALAGILGSNEYLAKHGGTNASFVDALYLDVLGRPADAGGKAGFVAQLGAGRTRASVARAVVTSAESRARLVRAEFTSLVRRPATGAEVVEWRGRLATEPLETLRRELVGSGEYLALTQA